MFWVKKMNLEYGLAELSELDEIMKDRKSVV